MDTFIEGSLSVSGLTGDESYRVDSSTAGKVTLTLFKDKNQTQTGVNATGSRRTITVSLSTHNNETVGKALDNGQGQSWLQDHTNTVEVRTGSASKSATAKATVPLAAKLSKSLAASGSFTRDGHSYPVYKFDLAFDGVSSDSFDVEDSFDTGLLRVASEEEANASGLAQYGQYGQVFGGDQYYQGNAAGTFTASATENGAAFHVSSVATQADGSYYPRYRLSYYLVVKDENALKTLQQDAARSEGGVVTLANNATWSGSSADATATFESDILSKTQTKAPSGTDRNAEFAIKLNPSGIDIDPESDTLTLTDEMSSNLRIDVTSIKATPDDGVSFDVSGSTLSSNPLRHVAHPPLRV